MKNHHLGGIVLFSRGCKVGPKKQDFFHGGPKITYPPQKFSMEPENPSLEKEIPIGNHHFQVPC